MGNQKKFPGKVTGIFAFVYLQEMIKIKLQERQTISTSEGLVDALTNQYNKNILKLVSLFLEHKYNKTNKEIYLNTLDSLKEKYPSYFQDQLKTGEKDFISKLSNTEEPPAYTIARVSIDTIIPNILAGNTTQKALISARMDEEEAGDQIHAYFKQRGFKYIDFDLEFNSSAEEEKNWGGFMNYKLMTISVMYPTDVFKTTLFYKKDIQKFIDSVDGLVNDTKRIVYHELQHLFVDVIQKITGFDRYGNAPRSRENGELPQNNPQEIQTYAQDSVTTFNQMIKELDVEPGQLKAVKGILLKKILNSSLSPEEENLYKSLNQSIVKKYVSEIKNKFELIKSYNQKFYNYALEILFSSARNDREEIDPLSRPLLQRYKQELQENIVMDKIKIILSENKKLLSEELTKEEMRRLIRDEFEKLLKDKETRKEIAKITKEFVKKFYRELSFSSTHIIDQVDV